MLLGGILLGGGSARADGSRGKMARPEGFEPPTNGFGSHYSIRLSYGRVVYRLALGTCRDGHQDTRKGP